MLIDASALVAVLAQEADSTDLLVRMAAAPSLATTPLSLWEAHVALRRITRLDDEETKATIEVLLRDFAIAVLPVTAATAELAVAAHARYGKGRHPASLNLGDCFSYAAAQEHGLRLLYKGGTSREPTSADAPAHPRQVSSAHMAPSAAR